MARRTFSLVAASVLIAFLCIQAAADEGKAAEKATPKELIFGIGQGSAQQQSVMARLRNNLYGLASEPKNQIVIAAAFLVFGAACLIDGARSFQLLVVVSVGILTSCFMLTQLGTLGRACSGIAAAEIGVFVAFAALLGWEGTQLMIGLGAGAYLYHLGTGLIALSHNYIPPSKEPHIAIHEANNTMVVAGYTVAILVGTFLVNDKGGAQRAFAIIAPLIGAAMVVSTLEFMIMFCATTPQGANALGTRITIDQLPAVFDYLYMIVFPFHSRPVGYFTHIRSNFDLDGHHIEMDKVIGCGLWFVFALGGICQQCKTISKLKRISAEEGDSSLRTRLLEPAAPTV